eukprot:07284.XXX_256498_256626_1 [CDS] Oithona nana genome sequencing.
MSSIHSTKSFTDRMLSSKKSQGFGVHLACLAHSTLDHETAFG